MLNTKGIQQTQMNPNLSSTVYEGLHRKSILACRLRFFLTHNGISNLFNCNTIIWNQARFTAGLVQRGVLTDSQLTRCSKLAAETEPTCRTTWWSWRMATLTMQRWRGAKRWEHELPESTSSPSVTLLILLLTFRKHILHSFLSKCLVMPSWYSSSSVYYAKINTLTHWAIQVQKQKVWSTF